jgi:hypothetical protein
MLWSMREKVFAEAGPWWTSSVFNGGGLLQGLNAAGFLIADLPDGNDPRRIVIRVITAILNFTSLIAVIMVIIAGFYLIFSMGEDDKKDKAKKIIFYTLIGLVVLLFARIIVGLVTVWLAGQV